MRQKVGKRQTTFEDLPNRPVTSTIGESVMRFDTTAKRIVDHLALFIEVSHFLVSLRFRHTNELIALELLQLGDRVFVNWADEEILEAFSLQDFKERRILQQPELVSISKVVYGFLHLGHTHDVIYTNKWSVHAETRR